MTNFNKRKVLFLITKSNWGGAQRYVYDLATNLDKSKFEVVVALGGNGELVERLHHAQIRVIQITSLERDISLKQEWQFIKELAKILKNEKPDVFHVNSSKAGGVGTFLGRIIRVPKIIFTAHGWAFNEDRSRFQKLIIKILHWITVILSHRTIAVSKALLDQLNWPLVERRSKVLHLGRNIGVMYDKEEAKDHILEFVPNNIRESISKKTLWLGNIGELHPIKRQDILLKSLPLVLQKYPDLKTFIIGEGSERLKLENLITQLNLSNSVFLLGKVSEAARLLKAFDIFAFPSASEAYGYVAHEAGLAGVAVVASNVGGIPEVIDNEINGLLIEPNNSQALTEALIKLLDSNNLRLEFSQKLKEKMLNRSLEKMVRATESLYVL
jgi:glycosyltransferase involved in cell wall biosynthesis